MKVRAILHRNYIHWSRWGYNTNINFLKSKKICPLLLKSNRMLTKSQYLEGTELGIFLLTLSTLSVLGANITDHFTTINEFFQERQKCKTRNRQKF